MQLLRQHFSCWNQSKQIEEDEKNANLIFRTKLDVRFRFRFVSTSTRRVSGKNCQSDSSTNSLISFPLSDECCNVSILSNQWKSKSQCLSTPATHCHCACVYVCVCVCVQSSTWLLPTDTESDSEKSFSNMTNIQGYKCGRKNWGNLDISKTFFRSRPVKMGATQEEEEEQHNHICMRQASAR